VFLLVYRGKSKKVLKVNMQIFLN